MATSHSPVTHLAPPETPAARIRNAGIAARTVLEWCKDAGLSEEETKKLALLAAQLCRAVSPVMAVGIAYARALTMMRASLRESGHETPASRLV